MKTVSIHGREYETVASRVERFREKHPDWTLVAVLVDINDQRVLMRADISDEFGRIIASGHAEEVRKNSGINATSALENCETSAWGRALAALGFGGDSIASADEMAGVVVFINDEQCEALRESMLESGTDEALLCSYLEIGSLEELPADRLADAKNALARKRSIVAARHRAAQAQAAKP